jgi:mannose-6-phosphate isomerase
VRPARRDQCAVGESWEVSVEPDFPGEIAATGQLLTDWLATHAEAVLGEEARRGRPSTALLVKLLDTAEPLSVQIHPSDDYAGLAAGEAGKPESWYVVDAEPNSGLYLGFEDGVQRADVERALDEGESLVPLLAFVPVRAGDFFVIDAGTPHAIGAGLTLVEPQHVLPGARGVTYRYWDWNRRYDSHGSPDPQGKPRTLHTEDALAVTRWDRVCKRGFAESIRHRVGPADVLGAARLDPLCGPSGPLASDWLQVWRAHGSGRCEAPSVPFLRSLTVLEGCAVVHGIGEPLRVARGHSAVLPACLSPGQLELEAAHAVLSSVA